MKKLFLVLFFTGFICITVISQNIAEADDMIVKEQMVGSYVERQPQFPGGDKALMKYLRDSFKYPEEAVKQEIQGRVVVQFVVTKTGEISDVKVVQPLHPSCDEEAVRLISSMPIWIPATQNGVPVIVYYTIPIRFSLDKDKKTGKKNNKK